MAKGVNIPLTISGLRQAREDLEKLNNEFEKVKDDPIQSKKIAKEFNDLSKAVDGATEELIKMNAAGKLAGTRFDDLNEVLFQTQEEVLPLTSQIGEMEDRMYQLAAAGDTSSKEFKALQSETARLRGVIIETDREIDLMAGNTSFATLLEGFGQLGDSVLSLNFKQAGKDLKALGGAFKSFGATLLANPIFLIVAVVAAIVAAVVSLKDKVAFLGAVFDFFAGIVNDAIQALKDFLDWIGLTNFAEQDLAQERKERAEENLKNIEANSSAEQAAFDRKIALLQSEGKSTVELEIAKQKAIIETAKARQKEIIEIIKAEQVLGELTKERLEELGKLGMEQVEAVKDAQNQIKIIENNQKKERNERAKERKAEKDKELAEDKARIDELNEYRRNAELEWLAEEEELSELIYQATLSDQERELNAVNDKYFDLIERAKQHGLDTAALEEEQQATLDAINQKYADKESARRKAEDDAAKKSADDRIKLEQDVKDAKVKIAQDGLKLVQNITELFGKNNEKAAKAAFAVDKAAKIASATAAGIEGAINAYKTAQGSPITALFPAYPAIQAGLASAFAATNIAKIAQTKFGGGAQTASSAPTGGLGGGAQSASASTPSFELFGDPNDLNNVQGSESVETNQTITVNAVVSESEVTNTQNKVAKMQKNAEL